MISSILLLISNARDYSSRTAFDQCILKKKLFEPEEEKEKISNSCLLKDITEHWLESGGLRNGEEAGYWTLINGKKFGESADGK